jgi:hypothetical protein
MRLAALPLTILALAGCKRAETAAAEDREPAPPRGKQISLLYSSNVHGEYEPCG